MLWDFKWAARSEEDGGGYLVVAAGLDGSRRPSSRLFLQISPSASRLMIEPHGLGGVLDGKVEAYLEDLFNGSLVANGQVIAVDEKLAKQILSY